MRPVLDPGPGSQSVPAAAVFAGHASDPVPALTDPLVDLRQTNISGQSRAASVTLSRRSSCPCPHRLSGQGPPLDSAGIPFPLDGAATTPVSGRRETSEIMARGGVARRQNVRGVDLDLRFLNFDFEFKGRFPCFSHINRSFCPKHPGSDRKMTSSLPWIFPQCFPLFCVPMLSDTVVQLDALICSR